MGEWEKAQATKNAIVGFAKHSPEISIHHGALYGVAGMSKHEVTIINNWGGEVSFPQVMSDELGGYLAGTFIEDLGHD